jgi:hypothetical protein
MSDEHFTVDGTLIEAWGGQKSFPRKDEDDGPHGGGDFHGEPQSNQTHASSTDPEARLIIGHKLTKRSGRITTGADKAYDTRHFVSTVRELGVTPHVSRR